MKPLVCATVLLLAMSAAAQKPAPAAAKQAQNSIRLGDANSCLALRSFFVRRSEHMQAYPAVRGSSTCTPANRFRVEYIPAAVQNREVKDTKCTDCAVEPEREQPKRT